MMFGCSKDFPNLISLRSNYFLYNTSASLPLKYFAFEMVFIAQINPLYFYCTRYTVAHMP